MTIRQIKQIASHVVVRLLKEIFFRLQSDGIKKGISGAYRPRTKSRLANLSLLALVFLTTQKLRLDETFLLARCVISGSVKNSEGIKSHTRCLHLHIRTHIAVPDLSGLEEQPSLMKVLLQAKFTKLDQSPTNQDDFVDAVCLAHLAFVGHKYIRQIIDELVRLTRANPDLGWKTAYRCFSELCRLGNHKAGEEIIVAIKDSLGETILDGSLYLTAVGHISQLWWLIKIRQITGKPEEVILRRNRVVEANSTFATTVLREANFPGWKLLEFDSPVLPAEHFPDLELYYSGTSHRVIRRTMGPLFAGSNIDNTDRVISLEPKVRDSALQVLADWGWPIQPGEPLVGIHVRLARDPYSSGRDSGLQKYLRLAFDARSLGYRVALVGSEAQARHLKARLPNDVINLAMKNSAQRELAQNYVWAHATFMVGNLSGGTMPAMAYGTPILWADFFPIRHFRPYSNRDLILPKQVLDRSGEMVNFREVMKPGATVYDLESLPLLAHFGNSVQEIDYSTLMNGFLDMQRKVNHLKNEKPEPQVTAKIERYYRDLELGPGAEWAPSFVRAYSHSIG